MGRGLWKMGSVPGDVRLAFGRTGEGPEPVLALHGITAQHRTFGAVARHLRYLDGMVALDLRGRGDSEKPPPGSYGLGANAGDVIRTLDYLGIERGVVVGHSMGAFVALHTALLYPDRIKALVLLDGGWPRPEEASEANEEEAAAVQEGLERAFRRLEMVFETSEAYLDFWFPGQNLTLEDLPSDLADYYSYDLEKVDGGFTPKASLEAAEEDAASVPSESPTAAALEGVGCPVALVRATEGFFPGSEPLFSDKARDVVAKALDLRSERLLPGANHYTMLLFQEYALQVVDTIDDFLQQIQ
jgi:lipase